MRERGPVAERHEAMDDRLRVHHDVDALVRDAEEVVRLDQLEALVDQRRGVHGDLAPHAPRRVRERLLGGDLAQLFARAPAEGAAGGREHQALDRYRAGRRTAPGRLLGGDQLVERGVLGVDGNDSRAAVGLRELGHEFAPDHERLLAGGREIDALAERAHEWGGNPADPTMAFDTRSASLSVIEPDQPVQGPLRTSPIVPRLGGTRRRVGRRRARSGESACSHACLTRSSHARVGGQRDHAQARAPAGRHPGACVPIEPVEPRMSRRLGMAPTRYRATCAPEALR